MININLLKSELSQAEAISRTPPTSPASLGMMPPEPAASPSPTTSSRFSTSSWQGIVLINIGIVVVLVALIMLLPANTPVIGGFIGSAKIALSRFFNMIF
jgi:hypothetical protein